MSKEQIEKANEINRLLRLISDALFLIDKTAKSMIEEEAPPVAEQPEETPEPPKKGLFGGQKKRSHHKKKEKIITSCLAKCDFNKNSKCTYAGGVTMCDDYIEG